jgi:polyisoprenoid-binding protein YceI
MTRTLRALAVFALAAASALPLAAQNPPPPGASGQQPPAPLPPNGWRVDPGHSAITFRVRHLGIEWVNGRFPSWTAELVYDPNNVEAASVTAHIRTGTVATDNDRRDADIRSGNYLAVDSFPEMVFVSRQVQRVDATHLRVTGDLTLRGVTKPVTLETELLGMLNGSRGKRIAFTATTTIRRQDFGVTFNRFMEGAQLVGDEVRITIDITALQPVAS